MYEQKVIWIGTVLGDSSIEDFEKFFLETLGYHVKYVEEFKMVEGFYKNLNCIVFSICSNEIPKFAMFRLTTSDMKWLEDFWENEKGNIPLDIYEKYSGWS